MDIINYVIAQKLTIIKWFFNDTSKHFLYRLLEKYLENCLLYFKSGSMFKFDENNEHY